MHTFFFGESDSPLYGVSHSPKSNQFQNSAILLINPQGHEYTRSHKALRQLADNLSKLGYFVMRFDYQATGDSAGDFQDITLNDWQSNIKVAADELRSISGLSNITAIGLRLGASLALMASESAKLRKIILWDPVVSGENYLQNIKQLHQQLLDNKNSWFMSPLNATETPHNEWVGYQYSDAFLTSLTNLNLISQSLPKRLRVKVLSTHSNIELNLLIEKYEAEIRNFSHFEIEDISDWENIMKIDSALLPHTVIKKIVDELSQ